MVRRAQKIKKDDGFVESYVGGDDASKVKNDVRTSTQTWIGMFSPSSPPDHSRYMTASLDLLDISHGSGFVQERRRTMTTAYSRE